METGAGHGCMTLCREHPAAHDSPITCRNCLGKMPGVGTCAPHVDGSGMALYFGLSSACFWRSERRGGSECEGGGSGNKHNRYLNP